MYPTKTFDASIVSEVPLFGNVGFENPTYGKNCSRRIETRSVGFTHESTSKFQTTSFTQHYRGQSPHYNVHRWGKGRLRTGGAIFVETSAVIPAQVGI